MLKHPVRTLAVVAIFALGSGVTAASASTVTVPATKAAAAKEPAAAKKATKMKPVRRGRSCKKALEGTMRKDAKGKSLRCEPNAKGKTVWTA